MTRSIRSISSIAIGAALGCSAANAAVALDFATAGQYTNNFATLFNGINVSHQSSGNYIRVARDDSDTQRATMVYDTTPADGATTKSTFSLTPGGAGLTVSADVRFSSSGGSWGIYFVNASNRSQAVLAIFNVSTTAGADNIRFGADYTGSPTPIYVDPTSPDAIEVGLTTDGGSTAGRLKGSTGEAGYSTNEFKNISVTYSLDALSKPVLTMTAGTRTLASTSVSSLAWPTGFSNVEVAFRASPSGSTSSTTDFDNFTIVPVPEPTSLALLGVAGLALARRRRV